MSAAHIIGQWTSLPINHSLQPTKYKYKHKYNNTWIWKIESQTLRVSLIGWVLREMQMMQMMMIRAVWHEVLGTSNTFRISKMMIVKLMAFSCQSRVDEENTVYNVGALSASDNLKVNRVPFGSGKCFRMGCYVYQIERASLPPYWYREGGCAS